MKKEYEPGIYDISNDEYHSSAGISRSGIKEFSRSPLHYWHRYINPEYKRKDQTPDMIFGSAFHCYVLEPEKFAKEYFISAKNPHHGASTLGKEFKANMLIASQGKILLTSEDFDEIVLMHSSIMRDKQAPYLIEDAKYEQSIYWIDKETGLLCKSKPDILHDHFVVVLKTTKDASPRAFQRDFYNYGYALQLGMIHEGIKSLTGNSIVNYIDLAVEKSEPYATAIYPIDESALQYGIDEFHYWLIRMKECIDKNEWRSYETQTITLPAYAEFNS